MLAAVVAAGVSLGLRVAEAQVDQARAATYFAEAAALCAREGGRLWGVSLCGPIVIADATSRSFATSEPAPSAPRPAALGYANAAMRWGDKRWTTIVWQLIPANEHARGRVLLHELYHRIQPQIGLFVREPTNDHLDSVDGRYWLQLEWRALAKALGSSGAERLIATRDALAFRTKRRQLFPGAAENEQLLEINEGLAQYTGTVGAAASVREAESDAIDQLTRAAEIPTFVRTFAYWTGAAYGILLDAAVPGWTRRMTPQTDLGQLLMHATGSAAGLDPDSAAVKYGGEQLRASEIARSEQQAARVAEFRRRFAEDPVLVLPAGRNASFVSLGVTPIPGFGTIYPSYRVTADWGSLEAAQVLVSPDRTELRLPAPANLTGPALTGDGWTLQLAPGWSVRRGNRAGDFLVTRDSVKKS